MRWLRPQERREETGELGFVRVANDVGDAGEGGEFFGSALGVTARDDDAGGGVVGMQFANGFTRLGIRGGSDGAGIEDDNVGSVGGIGERAAPLEELALNGGAVSLSGAAAELFDVEGGHGKQFTVYRSRLTVPGASGDQRFLRLV